MEIRNLTVLFIVVCTAIFTTPVVCSYKVLAAAHPCAQLESSTTAFHGIESACKNNFSW